MSAIINLLVLFLENVTNPLGIYNMMIKHKIFRKIQDNFNKLTKF